jgi:hypothetical protein
MCWVSKTKSKYSGAFNFSGVRVNKKSRQTHIMTIGNKSYQRKYNRVRENDGWMGEIRCWNKVFHERWAKWDTGRTNNCPEVTYLVSGWAWFKNQMPCSRAHTRHHCTKLFSWPYAKPFWIAESISRRRVYTCFRHHCKSHNNAHWTEPKVLRRMYNTSALSYQEKTINKVLVDKC